nr:MAG TPA: hypothetical protein [Caudoviricetes sp.]
MRSRAHRGNQKGLAALCGRPFLSGEQREHNDRIEIRGRQT